MKNKKDKNTIFLEKLLDFGFSQKEICKITGLKKSTLTERLKKIGLNHKNRKQKEKQSLGNVETSEIKNSLENKENKEIDLLTCNILYKELFEIEALQKNCIDFMKKYKDVKSIQIWNSLSTTKRNHIRDLREYYLKEDDEDEEEYSIDIS